MARDRITLRVEMLNIIGQRPRKQSHVFFKCEMNNAQGLKHLDVLLERGYVEARKGYYFLTKDGRMILEEGRRVVNCLG